MDRTVQSLFILYGTRSGNARLIAENALLLCQSAGFQAECRDVREIVPGELAGVRFLWMIVSTHGEGDPPAPVEDFYNQIHDHKMTRLSDLNYSVLALGDSNYRNFCQTGIDFDKRFTELGATRMNEVGLCDLDFEFTAFEWLERNVDQLVGKLPVKQGNRSEGEQSNPAHGFLERNRTRFLARITDRRKLSIEGSSKDIFHMSLHTGRQKLSHKPGDCIRIKGRNTRWFVDSIIRELGLNSADSVEINGKKRLLKELLINDYELTQLTPVVVQKYAALGNFPGLTKLINDKKAMHNYTTERDVLDLITEFPMNLTPDQFISILRRNHHRSYSIASGSLSNPDEIHLTVSWTRFKRRSRQYHGVASTYMHELLEVGESFEFEFEENDAFHFPESEDIPLIMMATSTGIAPFRALLLDRQFKGYKGNTWLFFGDRNAATDYLYEEEMKSFHQSGVLERLDAAFSRDQPEKIYLQDQIRGRKKELVEWIERGAHIYLCGTKSTMAEEIRRTLISIIGEVNFKALKDQKRYTEDIY